MVFIQQFYRLFVNKNHRRYRKKDPVFIRTELYLHAHHLLNPVMFHFRAIKIFAGGLTVFWIFFGEIASTFPFKRKSEMPVADHMVVPFTYNLSNAMSESPSTKAIDNLFDAFIKKRDIKGASVAVTYHGRLVYAKGFGYADEELGLIASAFLYAEMASSNMPFWA